MVILLPKKINSLPAFSVIWIYEIVLRLLQNKNCHTKPKWYYGGLVKDSWLQNKNCHSEPKWYYGGLVKDSWLQNKNCHTEPEWYYDRLVKGS